jgi:chromosome segregation ATPase
MPIGVWKQAGFFFWEEPSMDIRRLIIALMMVGIAISPGGTYADLEDIENDMEQSMSDSEAAREEAKAGRERKAKEKELREKAKVEAREAKARAEQKERDAKREIAQAEAEAERLKGERVQFEKETAQFQSQIQKLEKQIADKKQVTEKSRLDRQGAEHVRNEIQAKTAEVTRQAQAVETELLQAKDEERKGLLELEEAKKEKLQAETRFKQAKADNKQYLSKTQERVVGLKAQIHKAREETAQHEAQMRTLRQSQNKMEEETAMAEAEVEQAKRRSDEAKARLGELSAANRTKQAQLQMRKTGAQDKLKGFEEEDASGRISNAGATSEADRLAARSDDGRLKVDVTRKHTQSSRRLAVDCGLREKPAAKAKIVAKKKKGQQVTTETYNKSWAVVIDASRKSYAPMSCFEERTPSMQ